MKDAAFQDDKGWSDMRVRITAYRTLPCRADNPGPQIMGGKSVCTGGRYLGR